MEKSITRGTRLPSGTPVSRRNSAAFSKLFGGASLAALSFAVLVPGAALAQVAGSVGSGEGPAPATGQQSGAGAPQTLGEVVVTGSRIARRDFVSQSPIVTLNNQALTNQADLQIQNTLNRLPQFTPDQNLMGGAANDVQPTPTHSIGIATASLRGLGANRNLVLVDGRRAAPVNGQLVVDLNTIPASMIERVETITGGASAVYGADAVGGVVNFILRKNFRGADFDVQYARNQTGDGQQFQASAVFGTNFADDKGNLTIAIDRFQNDATYQRNHEFYTKSWSDPTVGSNALFGFGTGWSTGANGPSPAAVASVFPNATGPMQNVFTQFWVQGNTVYSGLQGLFGANNPGGAYKYPGTVNGYDVGYVNVLDPITHQVARDIKTNQTNGYIQAPLDRWSVFANGHYDFNENVSAYFQANFSHTHTDTVLMAPVSIITGWNAFIPYNAATNGASVGHPVPTELATLLNSRANPNAPWELYWVPNPNGPLPPRGAEANNTVYQIVAGLNGKVGFKDWTWDVYGSHSYSQQYTIARGDYSLARFQALLLAPGTNWGAGANITGNQTQPNGSGGTIPSTSPGFGAASVTCTSGFYDVLFNGGTLSQDCLHAIEAPLQSMNITTQDVVEATVQGGLFDLPAGEVRFAVGADYRRNTLEYNPDILQSDASFLDQVIGVYPTPYTNAATDVREGYMELQVPLLKDLPFVKSLSINPGARYSSYSDVEGGWTYKLLGDWEVNDFVRFRGGYNLAVRAPNLGELFLGRTEQFGGPGTTFGDACSLLSTAPWGAGGAAVAFGQTAPTAVVNTRGLAGAQSALAICRALMGPNGAGTYYGNTQPNPGPTVFEFTYQSGNKDLQPEEAKTYTAGVVLRSPFDQGWARRATLSVDWYKISIAHAIQFASIDYIYQNCLSQPALTDADLAKALASSFCQAVSRSPANGSAAPTITPSSNLATIRTSGVDVQLDWSIPLGDIRENIPGTLNLSVVSSFLVNYDTIAGPGQPELHWYNTLGPTLSGTNPGAYRYKLNTNIGYSFGPGMVSLTWRHLPKVHAASAVSPGNRTLDAEAYDVFDLNTFWSLPHNLQLRAGIQNLFNTEPSITGAQTGLTVNGVPTALPTSGQGTTNVSFYDVMGRRFYVGLKARF